MPRCGCALPRSLPAAMRFGQYGRESSTLAVVTRRCAGGGKYVATQLLVSGIWTPCPCLRLLPSGALTFKMVKRGASFDAPESPAGPPPEQAREGAGRLCCIDRGVHAAHFSPSLSLSLSLSPPPIAGRAPRRAEEDAAVRRADAARARAGALLLRGRKRGDDCVSLCLCPGGCLPSGSAGAPVTVCRPAEGAVRKAKPGLD